MNRRVPQKEACRGIVSRLHVFRGLARYKGEASERFARELNVRLAVLSAAHWSPDVMLRALDSQAFAVSNQSRCNTHTHTQPGWLEHM